MSLKMNFHQGSDPSIRTDPPVTLVTEQFKMYEVTDMGETLSKAAKQIENRIECYQHVGSGWVITEYITLSIQPYGN